MLQELIVLMEFTSREIWYKGLQNYRKMYSLAFEDLEKIKFHGGCGFNKFVTYLTQEPNTGWSGGVMVLGKLPVPWSPTIWMTVGQGPIVLAVGAGGGCLDIFTLVYPFFPLSPSLWETAQYRLKYCLKGPLNPKQPTNIINKGVSRRSKQPLLLAIVKQQNL